MSGSSPPAIGSAGGRTAAARSRTSSSSTPSASSARAATPSGVAQQAEQQVLGADVVVPDRPRLFLRVRDDLPRSLGEPIATPGGAYLRMRSPSMTSTRTIRSSEPTMTAMATPM